MNQSTNLYDYLERSSRLHPERPAVVDPAGRQANYSQLRETADAIGGCLVAMGVRPGDRVGVIAPKSLEVVEALFGIMAAGAAYVPADYTAPAERNRTLLTDCAVKALFLDVKCADVVQNWPNGEPPQVFWLNETEQTPPRPGTAWAVAASHAASDRHARVGGDGLAYILYTSGSTGRPKGVALTHSNATSFVDWCTSVFMPTSDDRFGSHAPFHFDLSILDIYLSIKHGATLYLVSEAVGKNPEELAGFISANRLTIWYSTPSILSLLAQFGRLDNHQCTELRIVLFAGEVFPVKHLRNIVERWPHADFYNLYGPTETNVCTFARIPKVIPVDRVEPYPIGGLCTHCVGLVLDVPGGNEVAFGEEGLLHIAGAPLFTGYWNGTDPGVFFDRNGQRFYNTGDVVRETADSGYLYVGRRDRMVKRRGYRIELAEVERGLYRHQDVREAAAISIPDPSSGVRIVAYVSPRPGPRMSIVELKTFCSRVLPMYMIPDNFVILEALPRTSTDKIDYQGLIHAANTAK